MWPGFGDNMRGLEWILKRCGDSPIDAEETAIGYVPKAEDIDISELDYNIAEGKPFTIDSLKEILTVDKEKWSKEAEEIEAYYNNSIKDRIPQELWDCLATLKANCYVAPVAEKPAKKAAAKKPAAKTADKKPAAKKAPAKTAAKKPTAKK